MLPFRLLIFITTIFSNATTVWSKLDEDSWPAKEIVDPSPNLPIDLGVNSRSKLARPVESDAKKDQDKNESEGNDDEQSHNDHDNEKYEDYTSGEDDGDINGDGEHEGGHQRFKHGRKMWWKPANSRSNIEYPQDLLSGSIKSSSQGPQDRTLETRDDDDRSEDNRIPNMWDIWLKYDANRTVEEHADWASSVHDTHTGGLRGVISTYNFSAIRMRGYSGELTDATVKVIEKDKDVRASNVNFHASIIQTDSKLG